MSDLESAGQPKRFTDAEYQRRRAALEIADMATFIGDDQRSLKLKNCDVAGSQIDGKETGVVLFRKPFKRSRLEFKGNVTPHHLLMASLKKPAA